MYWPMALVFYGCIIMQALLQLYIKYSCDFAEQYFYSSSNILPAVLFRVYVWITYIPGLCPVMVVAKTWYTQTWLSCCVSLVKISEERSPRPLALRLLGSESEKIWRATDKFTPHRVCKWAGSRDEVNNGGFSRLPLTWYMYLLM